MTLDGHDSMRPRKPIAPLFPRRTILPISLMLTLLFVIASAGGFSGESAEQTQVPTTIEDFFFGGSQPNTDVIYEAFRPSDNCAFCHEGDETVELLINSRWQGGMMAQAARDPLFFAALSIANQDANVVGDLCLRCHTPSGWVQGRCIPPDGSELTDSDRDGVSCSACHRMVDPVFKPGISPDIDAGILANISVLPVSPGSANYILDPLDIRRGPYSDPVNPQHFWAESPYHRTSEMCGTCHDVSNPVFLRESDGSYSVTSIDTAHPTGNKHDMFPVERTYSEFINSAFASTGVDMQGRFGGNDPFIRTCQDCHMPKFEAIGSTFGDPPIRPDLAAHDFAGGNAWVQDMILNLYPDDNINPDYLAAGKDRSVSMLQRAATLDTWQTGNRIHVRITNETGHKLPTGYPEGRRMWINVQVLDISQSLIEERGYYNTLSADLTTIDTKVYEAELGISETVASLTGVPAGKGFHFALNSILLKDNRIPPRGFTNAGFAAVLASPVAAHYEDGQYWDDTTFVLPADAASVTTRIYYQTASKEYITFLRDKNITNDTGDILYQQWETTGKSPPVLMNTHTIAITPFSTGDIDDDGFVTLADYVVFHNCATADGVPLLDPECVSFDFNDDDDVDLLDFGDFQSAFND